MSQANQYIKAVKNWALQRVEVRALILYGSRAQKGKTDAFSDVDFGLFVTNQEAFVADLGWDDDFGSVWVCNGQYEDKAYIFKILYNDGLLVDFSIHPVDALESMGEKLPAYMEPGYKILVDKDKAARGLPKPSGKLPTPTHPEPENYQQLLKAFWLDAYHLSKYLLRGELWRAKHFDWKLKQHLLQMMGWHALLCRVQQHFSPYEGKNLQQWIEPDTFLSLMTVFGRLYPADSWRALQDTIKQFTKLSEDVAKTLKTDPHPEYQQKYESWIASSHEPTD